MCAISVAFLLLAARRSLDPADGLAFVLASTKMFGKTGVVDCLTDGEDVGWEDAEDPLLEDSFGFAFKTYQNEELRVTIDGRRIATIPTSELGGIQFVDNAWHSVDLSVIEVGQAADIQIRLDDRIVYQDRVPGAAGVDIVPEPETLVLLILGTLGMVSYRRFSR